MSGMESSSRGIGGHSGVHVPQHHSLPERQRSVSSSASVPASPHLLPRYPRRGTHFGRTSKSCDHAYHLPGWPSHARSQSALRGGAAVGGHPRRYSSAVLDHPRSANEILNGGLSTAGAPNPGCGDGGYALCVGQETGFVGRDGLHHHHAFRRVRSGVRHTKLSGDLSDRLPFHHWWSVRHSNLHFPRCWVYRRNESCSVPGPCGDP